MVTMPRNLSTVSAAPLGFARIPAGGVSFGYQRSAAATNASTSAVVRARTMAASCAGLTPAGPRLAWLVNPGTIGDAFVAEPVALKTDDDALISALASALVERLEVRGQVGLEVHVEGRPTVSDTTRETGAGQRFTADDDRGWRYWHRKGPRPVQRIERRRSRDWPSRPQRAKHGDRLLETRRSLGGSREAVSRRPRVPAVPLRSHPEEEPPVGRDLEVEAIRASRAGWRFITLTTNEPTVTFDVHEAAIDRIVQFSTTGTGSSPGPMK